MVRAAPIDVLDALGDPLRWRIVELLSREELCVCHLVEELGVSQPLVSHHLRSLKAAGVVESERFRYWTYYCLRRDVLERAGERVLRMATSTPRAQTRRPCC